MSRDELPGGDSEWFRSQPIDGVRSGIAHARLAWAIRWLERHEVPPPPGSRVWLAKQFFERLHQEPSPLNLRDNAVLRDAAEHHRTAVDLSTIVFAALHRNDEPTPFRRDKLTRMLKGAVHERLSNTEPRDTQFELLLAAQLRLGGVSVVHAEPPDLRIKYGDSLAGIAAKRVSSAKDKELDARVKRAVEQLADSRMRGFVAVNLDSRFVGVGVDPSRTDLIPTMAAVFASLARPHARRASEEHVIGLIAYGYFTQWRTETTRGAAPEMYVTAPIQARSLWNRPEEAVQFRRFFEKWHAASLGMFRRLWSDDPNSPL